MRSKPIGNKKLLLVGVIGLMVSSARTARADDTSQNLHLGTGAGVVPTPGMIQASDGNFYGVSEGPYYVNGTVFQLSADGATYTTIYPFTGNQALRAGVAEGPDGNLYGTIYSGQAPVAMGAVFKLTKTGVYSTVHAFVGSDGANPDGTLLVASDGTLYGTTLNGGSSVGNSWGTIFTVDPAGTFSTIYDFSTHDATIFGKNPRSTLVFGNDGIIYGTTTSGGASNFGTIFALAADNTLTAVSLDATIGNGPHDLVLACDGNLYGRAFTGSGVIFKLNPLSGILSVLHGFTTTDGDFDLYAGDGNAVGGALIEGRNHSLYGVAQHGGSHSAGTVFELALDGTFSVRVNSLDQPWGILQGADGDLYGTGAATNYAIFKDTLPADEKTAVACPVPGGTVGGMGGTSGTGGSPGGGGAPGTGGEDGVGGTAGTGGAGGTTGPGGTNGVGGANGNSGAGGSKSSGGCSYVGAPGTTYPPGWLWLPIGLMIALSVGWRRRRGAPAAAMTETVDVDKETRTQGGQPR